MFKNFGEKMLKDKSPEEIEREEIKKIFDTTFTVESDISKTLDKLIKSQNFTEIDPRITKENFPIDNRERDFKIKLVDSMRDCFVEEMMDNFKKQGSRAATLYEALEFLSRYPETLEKIYGTYVLGSIYEDKEGNRFCANILKKDNKYSLLLEKLSQEIIKDKKEYYIPWPGNFLTVQETQKSEAKS